MSPCRRWRYRRGWRRPVITRRGPWGRATGCRSPPPRCPTGPGSSERQPPTGRRPCPRPQGPQQGPRGHRHLLDHLGAHHRHGRVDLRVPGQERGPRPGRAGRRRRAGRRPGAAVRGPAVPGLRVLVGSGDGQRVRDHGGRRPPHPVRHYAVSTVFFGVVPAVVFLVWKVAEGTLSIHSIFTARREVFYWLTVLTTFALLGHHGGPDGTGAGRGPGIRSSSSELIRSGSSVGPSPRRSRWTARSPAARAPVTSRSYRSPT